jgi:hypothetical protein
MLQTDHDANEDFDPKNIKSVVHDTGDILNDVGNPPIPKGSYR